MKVLRYSDRKYSGALRDLVGKSSLFDPVIEDRARTIADEVWKRGDAALIEFTERFDGARLRAGDLTMSQAELVAASLKADVPLRQALTAASRNIERFARKSLRRNWSTRNAQGASVGEKFDPFGRVGVYVPGGKAPLVSTALMTILLARVAGCREIVACTPCDKTGKINPAMLFAVRQAGATEIYRLGGAQAIAAMAYGTQTIRRVQKIFGPGNAYVVAAKRLVYGHVAVDLLPGPSELLVLADATANARFIAADLLAQAEHGSGHERTWLLTPSSAVLADVQSELAKQAAVLARGTYVKQALAANGWLIHVKSMAEAVQITNQLAPEHCEIHTRDAAALSKQLVTAGALFLGPYSPTVLGDYMAGPSHTLPTGGAGASFCGLTVDMFQRRTSIVEYSRTALKKSLPTLRKFAEIEGLGAHGHSAEIRFR